MGRLLYWSERRGDRQLDVHQLDPNESGDYCALQYQQLPFATNSAELTDQDKALLDKMIVNLTRLNFVNGEVDGYTDSTGCTP
jgi:outer membrane protein OmpA-like peptidoglycan-associated protein